nr:MAG: ORF1 [TTV-like mini virus]
MPYYWRKWRYPRRRFRYRRPWSWRTGGSFRRRRRRRYKRRVRRKLKTLPLREWQPSHIRKMSIKGLYCLFQANKITFNKNFAQYESSITREGMAGGGGFSLLRFNLDCLFEQNELARNIWTQSNKYFPLFRYTGCSIKIYRPKYVDAVVKFQTCYPMSASKLLYTGCQPSIMMMSKGSKKIRSQLNAPNSKPYKRYRLRPPQQMTNKWYFQGEHSKTGLLLVQSCAASFDQYYISQHAETQCITLRSLNTKIFKNLNFKNIPPTGYIPKLGFALYASNGSDKLKDLIWLGNTVEYRAGDQIKSITNMQGTTDHLKWKDQITKYMNDKTKWGNPFHHTYLSKSAPLWFGANHPTVQLTSNNLTAESKITDAGLRSVDQELVFNIRYNPQRDKGYQSNIYLKPNWSDNNEDLDPLPDEDLSNPGFPAWLNCFGFIDYEIKLGKKSQINTHYLLIHKNATFEPKLEHYIFVDKWFVDGNSEYLEGRTGWDNVNWYPMVIHQEQSINELALCGPGAPKLGDIKTAECKMEYIFHFKIGGCATPVEKVKDPSTQPTYATPSNILDSNSLQSPEEPIENFLYQFDWRRDQITETAAKRITQDQTTKKFLFTDATTTGTDVPVHQTHEKELLSSEEEETQAETLFQQLQLQRNKQKQLRYRIKQLLKQMQSIS